MSKPEFVTITSAKGNPVPGTRRYVLRAETASGEHIGYWTGKAGEEWVCADGNEAYQCSFDECLHKIALFNKRTTLTGIIFQGDEVVV